MIKKRLKKLILKSTSVFNKKIAIKFSKTSYYKAQAQDIKDYDFREKEKQRLSTKPDQAIDTIITRYVAQAKHPSSLGKALKGLYNKNLLAMVSGQQVTNNNILSLVGKPETLLLAYRSIRGNKGALTKGGEIETSKFNEMNDQQREVYKNSRIFPDGFSWNHLIKTSRLVTKGQYPWGTSKRIYVAKPGSSDKMRPLTIPPFMDRVVQKAIEMVLESIYEPVFELQNRSFGFRPNKGVHDAMIALTSRKSGGMRTAIEGDIEGAYNAVNKDTLISILSKKITDKKFLEFIRKRLDYDITEISGERSKPTLGIPQGGIDSPYLFNIYMHELDSYVHTEIEDYFQKLNKKQKIWNNITNMPIRKFNKTFDKLTGDIRAQIKYGRKIKEEMKNPGTQFLKAKKFLRPQGTDINSLRLELFKTVKTVKNLRHRTRNVTSSESTQRQLRFTYVRYADDWIFLTNGTIEIAKKVKLLIAKFLKEKLGLTLSEKKTLITDIYKYAAKYLGYEIRGNKRGPIRKSPTNKPGLYKKFNIARVPSTAVWTAPDRQRLIDRFHMKGYCSSTGFPRELPWLSTLDAHVIIERYNSVLRGICNYYMGYIRNNSHLCRWIYILRYSCFKTLAQKYKASITKIFKRFGTNLHTKSDTTIAITVVQKFQSLSYQKTWKLLTYKDLVATAGNGIKRAELEKKYWEIENNQEIGEYPLLPGRMATVTNDDYLEQMTWTSVRTQANLDCPCAICGSFNDVEQHHIKAIRNNPYKLIPQLQTWTQVMALRNRKQIPVCHECHIHGIHAGQYSGTKLQYLIPKKTLVDNRIVHIENYIHKAYPAQYYAKSLEEKGWKQIKKTL
jgi:retron-type reverse transcriptase